MSFVSFYFLPLKLSEFSDIGYEPLGVKDLVLVEVGLGGNFAEGEVSVLQS